MANNLSLGDLAHQFAFPVRRSCRSRASTARRRSQGMSRPVVNPVAPARLSHRPVQAPRDRPVPAVFALNSTAKNFISETAVSPKICAHRMGIFGHAPTGRGTIFIFRSKFLSYRGRGSPARQRMINVLPGKTFYAPQWACRFPT